MSLPAPLPAQPLSAQPLSAQPLSAQPLSAQTLPAQTLPAQPFLRDLVYQIRASDSYGRLDQVSDENLLRQYLVTPQAPGEIPLMCVVDPAAVERLRVFFRAVATGTERATALVTDYTLDLDAEGFGRAVVFIGRLVLLCEVLRDVNGFGFRTTPELVAYGNALVSTAASVAAQYKEVARAKP